MDKDAERFCRDYLETLLKLKELDTCLNKIGMSGFPGMAHLRKAVMDHGAETGQDLT